MTRFTGRKNLGFSAGRYLCDHAKEIFFTLYCIQIDEAIEHVEEADLLIWCECIDIAFDPIKCSRMDSAIHHIVVEDNGPSGHAST